MVRESAKDNQNLSTKHTMILEQLPSLSTQKNHSQLTSCKKINVLFIIINFFSLVAATSPSTKVNEESLTYLNQGQSYGIRMKRRIEEFQRMKLPMNTPLRVQLRVVFHDRRLQNQEEEQLKIWSQTRSVFYYKSILYYVKY